MNKKVQRYTWCDALIEAGAVGAIDKNAVNTGLRLARVINWEPKDGRPSGLYWDNEIASEAVGVARATFFRHNKQLKAAGFFILESGNLLPVIPESQNETTDAYQARVEALKAADAAKKSQNDTSKSQNDTSKSQIETSKSHFDNPYSEDIYTEDVLSEDEYTEGASVAGAPSLPSDEDVVFSDSPPLLENDDAGFVESRDVPQSQNETFDDESDWEEEWSITKTGIEGQLRQVLKYRPSLAEKRDEIVSRCMQKSEGYPGLTRDLLDEVITEIDEEEGDIW